MAARLRSVVQRLAGQVSAGLSLLGDRGGSSLGIFTYHRIAPRIAGVDEPTINVTPDSFRRQLVGLRDRGYQFWPLTRAIEQIAREESLPKKVAVITFDDGYESVYLNAWPVLRELAIPATVFLNTAYLDSKSPFPFDRWGLAQQSRTPSMAWQPLRWSQCHEMFDSGLIELGAHTHTHGDFRNRPDDFAIDLRENVAALQHEFSIQRPSFAFPFGRWHLGYVSEPLLAAARDCGVSCALTTECELVRTGDDPFGLGRFTVYDWDSPATLAARLRGWYGWATRWQNRLALPKPLAAPQPEVAR